ncbi:MAG: RNA polymerase sigma-70 factor (ECF subfamily) [Pirellulaceae bacterium]|jgi:RNA polymerase sigma-70 factor (ECF subfamily)
MTLSHDQIVQTLLAERPKFLTLAWGMLRDVHSAEDVYQDLLLKALQPERRFDSVDHLLAWSWQVARNRGRELLRNQKTQATVLDSDVLELLAEETRQRDAEAIATQSAALTDCLQQLTPNSQQLVKLRYVKGMRAIDVAEQLGRKANAVYVSLSRIYRTLADCIESKLADERAPQ